MSLFIRKTNFIIRTNLKLQVGYSTMYNFSKLKQYCSPQKQLFFKRLKHAKVKKVQTKTKDNNTKYSKTINLPKTDFTLWLNSHQRIQQDEAITKVSSTRIHILVLCFNLNAV